MFVWLFHRISGFILLVLVGIKILSGYGLTGELNFPRSDFFHTNGVIDIFIIFLFIFHSLYGVRTLLIDMGLKRERALFWASSAAALVIFIFSVYFVYIK